MKFLCGLLWAAVAIGWPGQVFAESKTNSAPGFSEEAIVETWGWIVAQQEDTAGIEISPDELASLLKGFSDGVHGQSAPCDLSKASPDLEHLGKARREKVVQAVESKNVAEANAFFATLKSNTSLGELTGGVRYEILKPGTGAPPKLRQTVNVHYTARLLDGTEFAQFGPMEMVLITNHAPFAAWVDGLQKIGKEGTMKFFVPPPLPPAEAFKWGISPGSARVFEVELLDLRDSTEQEIADALVPPAPEPEFPPSGYSTGQLFEMWGWMLAQKTRAAQFGLSEEQMNRLTTGIKAAVQGKPSSCDLQKIAPDVETFVNERRRRARMAEKQKRMTEMESLFASLKSNTNVIEMPSGLRYEIIHPGSGPYPRPNQFVKVNYTGRLIDGRIFDQTDPALGPVDIKVGTVIPGWSEGVQKINKGGTIKLYIPPSLGYGDVATGGIPPNSTLIFEIELLDIRDQLEEH